MHDNNHNVVGHRTLGAPVVRHPGSTATVHHVAGRNDMVAKVFHPGHSTPIDQRHEKEHLQQIGEFRGAEDSGGHHVIFAKKHSGVTLQNTHAWQAAHAANDVAEKNRLRAQAMSLVRQRNEYHAQHDGIVHTYVVFTYVFSIRHVSFIISAILIMAMSSTMRMLTASLAMPVLLIGVLRNRLGFALMVILTQIRGELL
jgi:hypothetical protein